MSAELSTQIIGGMFGLADLSERGRSFPPFVTRQTLFLASARSGIALLLKHLAPGRLWLPSFYCNHLLKTLQQCGVPVSLYGIGADLQPVSLEWTAEVEPGDLVIMVDYFGFPCNLEHKRRLKGQGAMVLEDACQALLSSGVGQGADFVLYSPRKFLGVPDGGLLVLNSRTELLEIRPGDPPADWWQKSYGSALRRRDFDAGSDDRSWYPLFREADAGAPTRCCAMSQLSRLLLLQGFGYKRIARQRIDNYRLLADRLGDLALFPDLPEGVVPLGFPVRLRDRDRVRQICFDQGIYPPLHWPIRGVVPDTFCDSHQLSMEIMTIPCDQRYGHKDMERVAFCISAAAAMSQHLTSPIGDQP